MAGVLAWVLIDGDSPHSASDPGPPALRYVALGDSYTIGEGVARKDRWPDQLAADLRRDGIRVAVVANPAVSGYTTADVLRVELPVLRRARADFATLQIGVNDWVSGVSEARFRENLGRLLDEIPRSLARARRLLVVTIPDFASTPSGALFSGGRDATAGIRRFNAVIRAEAARRTIPVADVFEASRRVRVDPGLVAEDGLHPSRRQYAAWVRLIRPAARMLLR